MSIDLAARKFIELEQKLTNLDQEFTYWIDQSAEGGTFEKHQSQISAITVILRRLQKSAQKKVKESNGAERLAVGRRAERMMLATQRIWEFFRSKLAQRKEERLSDYLAAADEFAWACYKPVRDRVDSVIQSSTAANSNAVPKEPPLVFFNGGLSPFSISRDRAFEGEYVPNELLSGQEFSSVLKSLPVPVIGVPWYQVSHLPDALVIGHEVGHTIEDDFKLTAQMKEHLKTGLEAGVDSSRHAAWQAWLGEIFADLYGCLATGPAFCGALMDFLARDPAEVGEEKPLGTKFGNYPPTHLRILFNLAALREIGFEKAAHQLEQDWLTFYPSHRMTDFEGDLKAIVPALLNGTYSQLGDIPIKQIFCFSSDDQDDALTAALMLQNNQGLAGSADDFRALFAAMRLAYAENPDNFVKCGYGRKFLERIKQAIAPGRRAGEIPLSEEQKKDLTARHGAMGEGMFDRLWGDSEPPS